MKNKKKIIMKIIKYIIIAIPIIAVTLIPTYNMVFKLYKWHISQPVVYQGGIEIAFFITLSFIFSFFDKSKYNISLILLFMLYLSTNGVIIPTITTYLYVESLLFVGFVFNKKILKKNDDCISKNLLFGVIVWGFFAIILSLLKLGTFNDLRILTIGLFLIAIIINKNNTYNTLVTRFMNYFNKVKKDKFSVFVLLVLAYVFGCALARSNTALDYDSLWYGLRPEFVLVGEHSFYDNLNFAGFVFYYPKLLELLLIPISNLGDYSFVYAFNILISLFSSYIVYKFLELSSEKKEHVKLLLTIAISCTPAIIGIATTAKPDIFGYYLVLCAVYFFAKHLKDKNMNNIIYSLTCLLLCTGTKETYLLWGGGIIYC